MIARIVRARKIVVALLLAITAAFGAAIPSLEARFAPEDLVAPDAAARADAERIARELGPDETPLVVVLEAAPGANVIDVAHLTWLHHVARALAAEAAVTRVEGPTTSPLPYTEEVDLDDGATLDSLDDAPAPAIGTPREEEAVAAIVGADPVRFPLGLMSLAERGLRRVVVAPLIPLASEPTLADAQRLDARLRAEPLAHRRIVSDDRRVAVLAAMPRADASQTESEALVRRVSALVHASRPPEGARVSLSGLPTLRVVMLDALHADQLLLIALAALGSMLVLVIGTRSLAGVLLPLGTVGITVVLSVGGMALAHVPLDLLTNMIPPLLVTIGLAEAVHIVLRYQDELAVLGDRTKAAVATLDAMWLACFVTTFTTAIGFGALVLSDTAALRRFGLVAGLASMVAYVVTVLFVPTLLPSFGPRALGVRRPTGGPDLLDRGIASLARRAAAHPRATIAVSAIVFVASLVVARGVVVDSTLLDQFAAGSDVARVAHLLERELDGVRRLTIEVRGGDDPRAFRGAAGLESLRQLAAHVAAEEGVLRVGAASDVALSARALVDQDEQSRAEPFHSDAEVEGLLTLLAGNDGDVGPLTHLLSTDGRAARIEVCLADRGAARILAMLERVRAEATRAHLRVAFAGEAYDASRGLDRIVSSLGSFTSAIVLIFVVMMLLFRSVRLGLLSIPPNLLPLAMTLAYMVLRGIALHAATVIVFTVTAGLLVDGATHVIARFREEQDHGGTAHEIMMRTMETSGRGVVLSSLTLLVGYGALLFSAFEPVRLFGELSGVAIGLALVSQLVLLPAVLARYALASSGAASRPDGLEG